MARDDHGLVGVWTVHEVERLRRGMRDRVERLGRHVCGLPVPEAFLDDGQDVGERRVAHDDQRGIVGPEPGVVEGHERIAADGVDALLGAAARERLAVGVFGAVHEPGQYAQRHGLRLRALARDGRQP